MLLWIWLVGCADAPQTRRLPADVPPETPDAPDPEAEAPWLEGPAVLALPWIEVGEAAPSAAWSVQGHTEHALKVSVSGPFSVQGDRGALDGRRTLEVTYSGSTASPVNVSGALVVEADGEQQVVQLAAVVGAPGLPAVSWSVGDHGAEALVPLPSAPWADGGTWNDPTVYIWVPLAVSGEPGVVTHLHGHRATVATDIGGWQLAEMTALSGRNAVLVVPQGPVEAASGDFGALMTADGHAKLVRDALSVLYRDGWLGNAVPGTQVLTAHSGGYQATARIVELGGLPIDAVHLFDALYGESATYAAFARGGGVLRSNYTAAGGTVSQNTSLRATLQGQGMTVGTAFDEASLDVEAVLIGPSDATHSAVMRDQRSYDRWLRHGVLPAHDLAPPELHAAVVTSAGLEVHWATGPADPEVWVEGSDDGASWQRLGRGHGGSLQVAKSPWVRLRTATSEPSSAVPGASKRWLVVDGFDRRLDGSFSGHTHDFAARLGAALGGASFASNEAVMDGTVALTDFSRVLWMLGDEGLADRTFEDAEQSAIEAYLQGGGKLIVSGAEVGFATSTAFLGVLGVGYVADDAGTDRAGGYTFGVTYDEDFPDVLSGQTTVWSYSTGGAAAVTDGQVLVVGFGLESMGTDLDAAVGELAGHFP